MKKSHSLTILIDLPSATADDLVIQSAIDGPAWVLDAGNCFDPYRIVRQIRRQTPRVESVLERIQVARAFTCFQVISLLEQTRISEGSVFVLRLLTTFADELVPLRDRLRLLKQVSAQLDRLSGCAPITVTLNTNRLESDPVMDWCVHLQSQADKVFLPRRTVDQSSPTLF